MISLQSPLFRVLCLLVIGILFTVVPLTAVAAEPPHTPRFQGDDGDGITITEPIQRGGLDLVLVIDNSESMYSTSIPSADGCDTISQNGNDEAGLRFDAAATQIDLLIENAIAAREEGNPVDHRIGIVTFGSTAAIDVPLRSLKDVERQSVNFVRNDIMNAVRRESLVSTDPRIAFALAADMLRDAPPTLEPRARGVLLITDGVPGFGCAISANAVRTYMGPFQADIERNFPRASAPQATDGYHVWVLATNNDWPIVLPFWQEVIGDQWRQIDGIDAIYRAVNEITQAMYPLCENPESPESLEGCFIEENFVMPPYVQTATFRVSGNTPTVRDQFQLFDQTGTIVDFTDSTRVTEDEPIGASSRKIEIRNPQAGNWRYETDRRTGVEVFVRQDLIFYDLTSSNMPLSQLAAPKLVFQLQDDEAAAVAELPDHLLTVTALIRDPNGQIVTSLEGEQQLAFTSIGNGQFETRDRVPFELAGEYNVLIRATRIGTNGAPVVVAETKEIPLTVAPVDGRIRPPTSNLTPLSTVNIEVEALGAGGRPIQVGVAGNIQVTGVLYPRGSTPMLGRTLNFVLNDQGLFIPDANSSVGQLVAGEYEIDVNAQLARPDGPLLLFQDTELITIDTVQAQFMAGDAPRPFREAQLTYEISDSAGNVVAANPQSGASVTVEVTTPSGFTKDYEMEVVDGKYVLLYTLPEAGPGDYRVKAQGSITLNNQTTTLFTTGETVLEAEPVTLVMVEPSTATPPLERANGRFRFEVHGADGKMLAPTTAPDFSGSVIVHPTGMTNTLNLTLQPDGSLGAAFTPNEPGTWSVQTHATFGPDQRDISAATQTFTFMVADAVPVGIHLIAPTGGQNVALRAIPRACLLPCGDPDPVRFELELHNEETTQAIPYDEATTRTPLDQIVVEVRDENGATYGNVNLEVDPNNPRRLVGTIPELKAPTRYTLVARLDPTKPPTTANYGWEASHMEVEATFSRTLEGTALVAGYAIDLSAILALLGTLLFAGLLAYFSSQPLSGRLEFMPPGGSSVPVVVPIRASLRFTPSNTFKIRNTALQPFAIKEIKIASEGKGKIRYTILPGAEYVKKPPPPTAGQPKMNFNPGHFTGRVDAANRMGVRVGINGVVQMRYVDESAQAAPRPKAGVPPRSS
jgi:hypothetical protein